MLKKNPKQKQFFKEIMNKLNSYIDQQDLKDHAKFPKNYGLLDSCDFSSGEQNPSCGDSVIVCGLIDPETHKILNVRFEGSGCVLSMAMASKLTELVKGMALTDVVLLNEDAVESLLGVRLGINRLRCGLLSITALQRGIEKFEKGLVQANKI